MQQQLTLHIASLTKKISKRQAEFNQLNQKITTLTATINALREGRETLYTRIQLEVNPLHVRIVEDRKQMVEALEQVYDRVDWKGSELKKLAHFITYLCLDLIHNHGKEELIPTFNRFSNTPYEQLQKTASKKSNVDEVVEEEEESEWEEEIDYQEKYAKERASKRVKKNVKRKAQTEFKSVRALYMELVKALHPDREPDEIERARKTMLMQHVTAAYQQNDLQALLQLQMEMNHIDQQQLEKLDDQQLAYYNSLLKQQVIELEQQKFEIAQELSRFVDLPAEKIETIEQVYFQFNAEVKSLKQSAKDIRSDLPLWSNADAVAEFLKNYLYN